MKESSNALWTIQSKSNIDTQSKNPYQLLPASAVDRDIVDNAYKTAPVPQCRVGEIKVVYNPTLDTAFGTALQLLQSRAGKPAFQPGWKKDSSEAQDKRQWRAHWETTLKKMSQPYQDTQYSDISILPLWHGTSPVVLPSIFESGYANLAKTDAGFFGKGLYTAYEAEYSYRCYSQGALVLSWVCFYQAYPVIKGDMKKLFAKGNYQNYDSHFAPVVPAQPNNPNEKVYYPTKVGQAATYHELVVFEKSQCLPRYVVTLDPMLLTSPTGTLPAKESYQKGLACIVNNQFRAAIPYLIFSANAGNPLAWMLLADLYRESGLIGEVNREQTNSYQEKVSQAIKTIRTWADKKDTQAQYVLGRCYALGLGVEQSNKQAFNYYSLTMTDKHPLAACQLGLLYEKGLGVSEDASMAVHYYDLAAQTGFSIAQTLLGFCHANGVGVTQDRAKAQGYFTQAAQSGYAGAQCSLGHWYDHGGEGIEKDAKKAAGFYKQAAMQGHMTAQYTLAAYYQQGHGVAQDYLQACRYYQFAAAQGHPMAKEDAKEVLRLYQTQQLDALQTHSVFSSSQSKVQAPPAKTQNCRLQ